MRYAAIKTNDVVNGEGISVSVFLQGCPAPHCKNCFNPETWDFNSGQEMTPEVFKRILTALTANNIKRNLSILGGEPMCEQNVLTTLYLINYCLKQIPDLKIYIWTRYLIEELHARNNSQVEEVLSKTYCLIDGPFVEELKDLTLKMRGSSNQRLLYLKGENK